MIKKILKRLVLLPFYWNSINRHVHKKCFNDEELSLYSKIIPSGFLNYGYFTNYNIDPTDISIQDITNAQFNYANLLLNEIEEDLQPVLDVGCGIGGLANLVRKKGISVVALTPDKNHSFFIKERYKNIPLIESTFESINVNYYNQYFGTIINSESLQYINLKQAVPLVEKILKSRGRWIITDYFRLENKSNDSNKSGHIWEHFLEIIEKHRFTIVKNIDITKNIIPTLHFVNMMANNFAIPVYNYGIQKLKRKKPIFHYLIEDIIKYSENKINKEVNMINPDIFIKNKIYKFIILQKNN